MSLGEREINSRKRPPGLEKDVRFDAWGVRGATGTKEAPATCPRSLGPSCPLSCHLALRRLASVHTRAPHPPDAHQLLCSCLVSERAPALGLADQQVAKGMVVPDT